MPAPPEVPVHWYGLSKFQSCSGQFIRSALPTSDQSSFLICACTSAASRAVVIGLESQPIVACVRSCSNAASCACLSFLPRSASAGLRPERSCTFTRSEQRQARLAVARDRDVDVYEAREVLVVRLHVE